MYIYETKLAKASLVPTQLEFLRAAHQRGLLRLNSELNLYRNLEFGAQGEQFVMEMLEKYGQKHWVVLQNLWMDCQGIYESDIVLLTSHTPYAFEVKNYNGLFEYKNDRCVMNGSRMKENCIQQAEKSLLNLQDICRQLDRSISAKGALLLVGEHNEASIQSSVDGIEVKMRYQLRNYIQEIARLEEAEYHKSYDIRRLLDHFEKREKENPFGPHKSYTPEEVLEGKRGIYCDECGTYEVESSRKLLKCKNNHEEPRREAIIRMIHEFGVLTFEHDFMTQSDLRCFMEFQMSEDLLLAILNSVFEKNQSGRYANYVNKKALY